MKAKELANELMKNPDAIICVWEGEPNDTWVEVTDTTFQENQWVDADDGYRTHFQKVDKVIKLGYNR